MEKKYRPLSDKSKAYKTIEKEFDEHIAPTYLEDAVIQKLPFETAYDLATMRNSFSFFNSITRSLSNAGIASFKSSSIDRYLRHIVAKRRKEYEVLISKPFLWRLRYFITRTVRGK